ncbi:polysaccharide lyase 8 family protein [Enemella evansiae]|uniref:polysaccharide lyase 8 family protein n=1 Tax=Enemella evansiae TaxID=2016499 RepID=UPI001060A576|nr:polysaccharide lyase 8 family protein [Enemella evansiae]TDO91477.1 hyaluronate lyase [Enemella evansiae]
MATRGTQPNRPVRPELTMSRRRILALGAAGAVTGIGPAMLWSPSAQAAVDPFDDLRQRWVSLLTGGAELDRTHPRIASQIKTLSDRAADFLATGANPPPAAASIWADLPMSGPKESNIALSYQRILAVATAWATQGTAQYADPAVAATLVTWYQHMTAWWYNLTVPKVGNWWFWEIGIPRTLGDLSILIDGLLTQDQRDAAMAAVRRFTPDPNFRGTSTNFAETGGNRADKALACLLRGITARSETDMTLGRDALSDRAGSGRNSLFRLVTSGNGFYADGSYIDHGKLPYVGTYGNVALSGVARSLVLLANSRWAVTDPQLTTILDAPERSFAPFIWNGRMLETVRGRAVSRERERDFHDGFNTANSLILLATQMAEPYATAYRRLAKGWLTRCSADYAETAGIPELSRALPLLADTSVVGAPEPLGNRQFGSQERMVHRGPGWAFSVATSSNRIGRYEWGNDENNLGWHQGDGAAYLYLDGDQGQFADDYWPTVDPYRLPGTTASLAPRASGADGAGTGIPAATNPWSGGVGLAGRWGTAGMDLVNTLGNLSAKKSWFLLDDAIVAVGSGIRVTGSGAETTVENRGFPAAGRVELTVDGADVSGAVEHLTPRWAHLAEVAGYLFLGEQSVRAAVAERSGTWRDVNSGADTGGSTALKTRRYATLGVRHDAGTTDGRYGYVILPGRSREQTIEAASEFAIEVVRQDDSAHIVRVNRRGTWFLFAHLFAPVSDGPVTSTRPCALLAAGRGRTAQLAVSSPTRIGDRAQISVDLTRPFRTVVSAHERLRVSGGRIVTIDANLAASADASFEVQLTN